MSLRDPLACSEAWVLSTVESKNSVSIPNNLLKKFGRQDIVVLDFLYRSYLKQLKGVILNEEEDLNSALQVSSFLGALNNSLKNKFLVLVLCPDNVIIKWHYYMSQYGNFEVKIINPHTVPEDFDQDATIALLLSFSNIKLADYLKEYDFFSVIIDSFDQVATKLAIRKLQGEFNIGISSRNFYVDPDQKVQWTMLNWTNPGCVGKLADFYGIDNDNFANSRDSYKEWWFRLTWNFCDSFVKPSLEEKGNLNGIIRDWGKAHNLVQHRQKNETRTNKRKRRGKVCVEPEKEHIDSEDNKHNKPKKRVYKNKAETTKTPKKIIYTRANTSKKRDFRKLSFSSDSSDSNDTIIYENDSYQQFDDNDVEPEKDEPPIGGLKKNNEPCIDDPEDNDQQDTENPSLEKYRKANNFEDDAKSDNDSVSSGEQILCSLVRNKYKKSPEATNTAVKSNDLSDNFDDESDLFLKSVAATSTNLSPIKKRKKAEAFFNKILDKSEPKFNSLTRMELELTEKEITDVPSESDNFFKGIFNNTNATKRDDTNDRSEETDLGDLSQISNVSASSGGVDVESLVAEVMEIVGGK